jgi:hypothetical protein
MCAAARPEKALMMLHVDKAFFGVDGISRQFC